MMPRKLGRKLILEKTDGTESETNTEHGSIFPYPQYNLYYMNYIIVLCEIGARAQ